MRLRSHIAAATDGDPEKWQKIAQQFPHKSVEEVFGRAQRFLMTPSSRDPASSREQSRTPPPSSGPASSDASRMHLFERDGSSSGETPLSSRTADEKRKGVPWTEEEHRLFLEGLQKFGKGAWRNISYMPTIAYDPDRKYFVVSRTPTQVASHAQKYYIRQGCSAKDKRRSSIHDIVHLSSTESHLHRQSQSPRSLLSSSRSIHPHLNQTTSKKCRLSPPQFQCISAQMRRCCLFLMIRAYPHSECTQ
jgi:hypothetical protein